jgi:glutathione S-transferase
MKAPTEEARTEKLKVTHGVMQKLEEAFSKCSNGKAFFGGGSIGYIDLALGCFLPWFDALRKMFGSEIIDAGKFPRLTAWAEQFWEVAEVKEVMPDSDKAMAYAKKLLAYFATAAK